LYPDATEEFAAQLNDPTRWAIKRSVPIFKPHRRVDPNSGREIVVDVPKLYRIAENLQRLERDGGVPIRMTLGHTEPGKPETEQPPVAGYYRNARVAAFGPKGEPAVVVDEWLDPTYRSKRKNFPYRSSEYYDDTEQITGVALLTRDPYLDLGVVAYEGVTLPVRGPVLYSAAGQPRAGYLYLLGDTNMWPYGYDANGQPLPAPQQPTVPPVAQPQAQPVYPTPYQAPHVQTGYGYPTPAQSVPAARGPAPVGYSQPQPAPLAYGQQASGAPFTGGYNQSPAAMSHSNDWQFRSPNQGQRYADQIPGQTPVHELMGPGTPPHQGVNAPEEEDEGEADMRAMHHHLTQAVEGYARMYRRRQGQQNYSPAPTPQRQPSPGFPPGQGSADSPYSRLGAGRYEGERLPVAYQLELDKLRAKMIQQDEALKIVMYERDQADTASCEAEIRRLASMGYAVDGSDVVRMKNTPVDRRQGFLNEVMTKYSRVGTEALPPIMGDPSPMHQVGPDPTGGRASREDMLAALRMTPENASPEQFTQALHYARSSGSQQFGMNGEVQGPGNPFGDPYGT